MPSHNVAGTAVPFAGPLYAQVAAVLRSKICSSEWSPSAPLPNEASLAKDIGVSIGTVRKALEMLEVERLIDRRQGRGTFIVEISEETELERFSNLVAGGAKLKADPKPMTASVDVATTDECARLNLRQGQKVIRFEAVWTAGNGVRAAERVSISHERFAGLEKHEVGSGRFLFPHYRRLYNVVIAKVVEHVSCLNADEALAKKLEVRPDQALLRIDRVARAVSVGPVEWSVRHVHMKDAAYTVSMV